MYQAWKKASNKRAFCLEYGVNGYAMQRAEKVREQLKMLLEFVGVRHVTSCGRELDSVRKCLAKASFTHCARLEGGVYSSLTDRITAKIHPTSVLFARKPQPEVIVYTELVSTSKNYLRNCVALEPAWLVELCGANFSLSGNAEAEKQA